MRTAKFLLTGLVSLSLLFGCTPVVTTDTTPPDEGMPDNSETENTITEYVDLEPAAAYELTTSGNSDLVIIDVSPRFEKGHLPNAINYYVGDGSLDEAIPGLDKNKTYLVYCHVDSASISGAEKLANASYPNVYRLKDNYPAWYAAGYPIEIPLMAVNDYSGSGSATRSFVDGIFMHTVKADLADPAEGNFYEGWLVKGSEFFSTGKLEKDGDMYVLQFESNEDSRDYKTVVITEETEADDQPEEHVLEGEFE